MHRVPDALSRIQEEDPEEVEIAAFEEVKDPWYLKRIEEIQMSPAKYHSWRIDNGLIYRQRNYSILGPVTGEEDTWKLVIPAENRDRVLRDAHCEATAGDLGIEKTYERVAQEYYWPEIWHDVYQFVQECDAC